MLTPPHPESPPVPDNRDWTETMTWRTFTVMGTCHALFVGDIIIIIALADADSHEYWEYATSIALFQLVAFIIIAFLVAFIYRPPSGSIEEITGPNCRQFENAESFGKLLCFTIAVWSLWWFWIDYRCESFPTPCTSMFNRFLVIPFCIVVFGVTLHYSSRWIIGIPSFRHTRFPPITPSKPLKEISLYKDSAV